MYDIELFKNIFGEGEIIAMTPEFMDTLKDLLDDKMSVRVKEFFVRFEKSGIREKAKTEPIANLLTCQVDLLHHKLDATVRSNTFHIAVEEKEALQLVKTLNITTAMSIIRDRDHAEYILSWLLENRAYWRNQIPVRKKETYELLLKQIENFEPAVLSMQYELQNKGYNVEIKYYKNLLQRIKSNKEFFYSPNEKKRVTRMGPIIAGASTLIMILHGLKYNKICNQRRLTLSEKLRIVPGNSR